MMGKKRYIQELFIPYAFSFQEVSLRHVREARRLTSSKIEAPLPEQLVKMHAEMLPEHRSWLSLEEIRSQLHTNEKLVVQLLPGSIGLVLEGNTSFNGEWLPQTATFFAVIL